MARPLPTAAPSNCGLGDVLEWAADWFIVQRMKGVSRYLALLLAMGGLTITCLTGCKKTEGPPLAEAPKFNQKDMLALEAAAEAGDPVEKYKLGRKYRDGDTVPQNASNAVVWFRKSAEGGYAKAQYHLGLAYEQGEGVVTDAAEAVKWHKRAAEQDNGNAQERLGFLLWKGGGAVSNLVEAHKWLSLGAANGEGKAAKGVKKIEAAMNPQQIAEAKKLAAAFIPKKEYKSKKLDKEK
jgi:TPR repeat protein